MGVVILLVLAGIWAAVLIPPIVRARSEGRPVGSVGDFNRRLQVLARTNPAGMAPARSYISDRPGQLYRISPTTGVGRVAGSSRRRSQKRRRDILIGLLVAAVGSLVLGVVPALRVLWMVHVFVDVLIVAYVGALVYLRNLAAERDMKVRFLPSAMSSQQSTHEPALLLRRSAN